MASYADLLRSGCDDPLGRLLTPQIGVNRAEAEQFITERFRTMHGADLCHFMPTLLGARDGDGQLIMVCGTQMGVMIQTMFLECYLKQPVDAALSAVLGRPVSRARLVEVGNLAVAPPATARQLIVALTHRLALAPIEWVVFTAVPALRNAFRRMSIPLIDLGPALITDLPDDEQQHWGTYYSSGPRVYAVSVKASLLALVQCHPQAA